MLTTFTHANRPCWFANTVELCTKQTRNRVSVTHPLAVYKQRDFPSFLPTIELYNQNVSAHALCAIYIFHGKSLLATSPKHNAVVDVDVHVFCSRNVQLNFANNNIKPMVLTVYTVHRWGLALYMQYFPQLC